MKRTIAMVALLGTAISLAACGDDPEYVGDFPSIITPAPVAPVEPVNPPEVTPEPVTPSPGPVVSTPKPGLPVPPPVEYTGGFRPDPPEQSLPPAFRPPFIPDDPGNPYDDIGIFPGPRPIGEEA